MGRGKFLRSLKQRWWLLALLVLPATLGTFLWTLLTPARYEGFMTMADQRERDQNLATIFPDQNVSSVNEQEVRVVNLANTIGSYTVLKQSYDELVARGLLKPAVTDERDFITQVSVVPLRGSEFLKVSYVASNIEEAKTIIQIIKSKFIERFIALNQQAATNAAEFIEASLKTQRAKYDTKLQEQKEFMDRYPEAASYETSTNGIIARLNEAKQRLLIAQQEYASTSQQYAVTRATGNTGVTDPGQVITTNINPAYSETEARLNLTRSQLQGSLQTYGEKHPVVLELRQRITEDEERLAKMRTSGDDRVRVVGRSTISGLEENRRSDQYRIEGQMKGALAAQGAAQQQISNIEATIAKLPVIQKELSKLQADLLAEAQSVQNLTLKAREAAIRADQNATRTVTFLDDAQAQPVDPRTLLKTIVALLISLIIAFSLIATLGQLDQATYTSVDAENSLGFPVLASLPKSTQQRLNPDVEQPTPLAASYQILSTQIMAIKSKLIGPGILVASAEPATGRSTVAANLAISLARDGARVLLVDADLRAPALHEHFGLQNRAGLSEILGGEASLEDVVQPTGVEGLLFIAAGQPPLNPVRMFRGEAMEQLIEKISKGADFIVFDSPAGSTFGDPLVLAENVQNVVLVHEAGRPATDAEYDFHKGLERLGVNVIGMVLNKMRPEDCAAYQHFRKNYQDTISRYHSIAGRAALGPGSQPVKKKSEQSGAQGDSDDE